jgi:phospholipase C
METRFGNLIDAETQRNIDLVVREAGRMVRLPDHSGAPTPEGKRAGERLREQLKGLRGPDMSVGALLNDEVKTRKIRPVAVELWATKITCVRDFDREVGRDEIFVGAVAHDIYNNRDTLVNPVKVGEFGGKKDRKKTFPIKAIKLAAIPVEAGMWRDSLYFATVYLGEKDFGGMKKYMEKSGLSSQQFIELTTAAYCGSLASLLGVSITAEMGVSKGGLGRGLLAGLAVGLGPMFSAAAFAGMTTAGRALAAGIAEAVIGAVVHAVADDMFPPQAVPLHLFVPPGGAIETVHAVTPIPFRFTQEKRTGNNLVQYDLHCEWRVKTAPATDADLVIVKPTEAKTEPAATRNLDKIENIVVVMLENRSFDQMLGFLTMDRRRQDFDDGLSGDHSNTLFKSDVTNALGPEPDRPLQLLVPAADVEIKPEQLADTLLEEDPIHSTQAVARQVFGQILPDVGGVAAKFDPHWPAGKDDFPDKTDADNQSIKYLDTQMKGFVRDRLVTLAARGKIDPKKAVDKQVKDVMGYHTAEHLPAYDLFATEFAVCDRWFSSFPGNTWVNRTIALTGSPARQTDVDKDARKAAGVHQDHVHWIVDNQMPFNERSFFRTLDANQYKGKAIEWAFYSQDVPSLLCIDGGYASELKNRVAGSPNRLRTIGRFFKDAEDGKLPHVAWVDPNFMDVGEMRDNLFGWNPPDERASGVVDLDYDKANDDHPPIDVSHGQSFVLAIVRSLMKSPQWSKTMLIVTYDEHGGFHDHIPPPPNPAFETPPNPAFESPAFSRLGARVPAFVVSPWVDRQLVSHRQFDHTAIIKTILTKFCRDGQGRIPPVSKRVDMADHLGWLLNAKAPRFVANSTRGASMSNFAEGLATVMKVRRENDKIRQRGVKRDPTELQQQMHEGRREVLGRIAKLK